MDDKNKYNNNNVINNNENNNIEYNDNDNNQDLDKGKPIKVREIIEYFEKLDKETRNKEKISEKFLSKRKNFPLRMIDDPMNLKDENILDEILDLENIVQKKKDEKNKKEIYDIDNKQIMNNIFDDINHSLNNDKMLRRPIIGLRKNISKTKKRTLLKYDCPICNHTFNSEINLNIHYSNIHTNNNNECRCIKCGMICKNDSEYNKHKCSGDGGLIDNIPIDTEGNFKCPICNNSYSSINMMGEHFMLSHNRYEDYCLLDDKMENFGFPGFEILEYIGMIKKVDSSIYENETCPICYEVYNQYGNKINNYNNNYDIKFYDINLKYHNEKILPLVLSCCKMHICYECLETYLTLTNSIVCPFCKKDHTKQDIEYIIEIIQSDIIDNKKWINWWTRNMNILL